MTLYLNTEILPDLLCFCFWSNVLLVWVQKFTFNYTSVRAFFCKDHCKTSRAINDPRLHGYCIRCDARRNPGCECDLVRMIYYALHPVQFILIEKNAGCLWSRRLLNHNYLLCWGYSKFINICSTKIEHQSGITPFIVSNATTARHAWTLLNG